MIRYSDVCVEFDGQQVLHDISFELEAGRHLAIVGGSGSGKTVLVSLLLGLHTPSSGEVSFKEEAISSKSSQEKTAMLDGFGVVFQSSALFDSLNILENVGIKFFENRTYPPQAIQEKVIQALSQVDLASDILNKYPAELSGGMQKRVGIARAILHQPEVLVCDEPSAGLDPVNAGKIDELLSKWQAFEGRSSLIITHDMESVRQLADQVLMLKAGRLHFFGPKEAFLESIDPDIRAFLSRGRS
ncbi:ATP-binding cassette domain-containing protein [Pontibacter sp. G13]|uniref:ABC transporter ATP-binding protein n=1 Tax=Pontibacter sp. G13 TaxID=3074898 RepID=UPI00288B4144|nr:ATP-binding cassette domain-containing protein [Pontibacter sp. G13]WNJ18902.1 ATP-binding cassette domain-containing protein [Pontibacter sp. G13]